MPDNVNYINTVLSAIDSDAINHITAVVSTLDGVTTVLTGFILVCLIYPHFIKNRTQYYVALASVVGVILLHTLTLMLASSAGFVVLAGAFTGFLQILALLMLVLSVGGLSAKQLAGDMARAYEVIRRGETEKETIIPIGDQAGRRDRATEDPHKVYHVDTEESEDDKGHEKGIPLT
jgi:hypothetical protein